MGGKYGSAKKYDRRSFSLGAFGDPRRKRYKDLFDTYRLINPQAGDSEFIGSLMLMHIDAKKVQKQLIHRLAEDQVVIMNQAKAMLEELNRQGKALGMGKNWIYELL